MTESNSSTILARVTAWIILVVSLCTTSLFADMIAHGREGQTLWVSNSQLKIEWNLSSGDYACRWNDGTSLSGVSCEARLGDGTALLSSEYTSHESTDSDIQRVDDELGHGLRVTVHHRHDGVPELRQQICIYEELPYFVTSVDVVNSAIVSSNHVAPISADSATKSGAGLHLSAGEAPSILFVPFDNDAWVRFNNPHDPKKDPDSYEVTAVYDNASRRGVVIGSITHDTWKTGIETRNASPRQVGRLCVYGGATGSLSRDSQPHGMVSGETITSPRILVGCFADWRDGLETFGRANAHIQPPLPWDGGVIFGWNSWAAYRMKVDYDRYLKVSDFLKQQLQPAGFENNGAVYINWDSGWNKCTEEQLREGVKHLHANGQKAGMYWAPFGAFKPSSSGPVDGPVGNATWKDLELKDHKGKLLPKLDGGQPLDATNPIVLKRLDWQLARFVDRGFDFVKLDFLNFASLEGAHADPKITTGIEAYNLAMQRVLSDLDPKKIGRPFFISLSIAPIFPSGYGHSRRISCDAFGQLENTEYLLNSLTFGWWMDKTLYAFNDPDHIVLTPTENDKPTTKEEARSRFNASVIAGTTLIDSDDLTDPNAQDRARELLTNAQVNFIARAGSTFRPVEGDSASHAADTFMRQTSSGSLLLAVFNYSADHPYTKTLDLERIGLVHGATYFVRDLWTAQTSEATDKLTIDLGPGSSKILELVKQ